MFGRLTKPGQSRYLALDGMRGVAALLVMVHHFGLTNGNSGLAVDLFFILSGFVITHSYAARLQNDMSVSEYICRRCIRLYPMFILGVLIGSYVLYLLMRAGFADYSKRDIFDVVIHNGLFLPYFANRGIQSLGIRSPVVGEVFPADPPAWSLFFELFASFIFVALLKMEKRILIRTIITSYVILALGGAQWAFVEYHYDPNLGLGWGTSNFLLGFPRVLFGFTFGVFLYRFANEGNWIGVRNTFRRYNISPWLLYFSLTAVLLVPITLGGLYSALVLAIVAPMLVFFGAAIDCNNVFDAAA